MKNTLDKKHALVALFMDLSKAFDCLPHGLLVAKLHAYRLTTTACCLFGDHLSGRRQQVKIFDARSARETLAKGVLLKILNSRSVTMSSLPCVKDLGVNIDNRLTFTKHVSSCCTKAAIQLNAFCRISKNLDLKCRKLIFQSSVLINFTYCPLVWHFYDNQNNGKIEKNPRTGTGDTIWWLRLWIQRTPW